MAGRSLNCSKSTRAPQYGNRGPFVRMPRLEVVRTGAVDQNLAAVRVLRDEETVGGHDPLGPIHLADLVQHLLEAGMVLRHPGIADGDIHLPVVGHRELDEPLVGPGAGQVVLVDLGSSRGPEEDLDLVVLGLLADDLVGFAIDDLHESAGLLVDEKECDTAHPVGESLERTDVVALGPRELGPSRRELELGEVVRVVQVHGLVGTTVSVGRSGRDDEPIGQTEKIQLTDLEGAIARDLVNDGLRGLQEGREVGRYLAVRVGGEELGVVAVLEGSETGVQAAEGLDVVGGDLAVGRNQQSLAGVAEPIDDDTLVGMGEQELEARDDPGKTMALNKLDRANAIQPVRDILDPVGKGVRSQVETGRTHRFRHWFSPFRGERQWKSGDLVLILLKSNG